MKKQLVFFGLLISFIVQTYAQEKEIIYLWPDKVPNELSEKSEPVQTPDTSGAVIRITNITNPKLTIFKPEESVKNNAAIIISPGGGYRYLAINKEGYEVAEWFNKLGFTTFVLEYRTPNNRLGALNDIQRAIRTVRNNADNYKIESDKIGVIGFSAGGNLSLLSSTSYGTDSYDKQNKIDEVSSRPDFSILMYPSSLQDYENKSLSDNIDLSVNLPPIFMFGTADDFLADGFFVLAKALKDNKANFEFHLFPEGGHGYGLRQGNPAAEAWPNLVKEWVDRTLKK